MKHFSKALYDGSRVSVYEYINASDCQAVLTVFSPWPLVDLKEEKESSHYC